jgi:4-diphosphocytidyl-2-C-methyl-D-erythritol kinase
LINDFEKNIFHHYPAIEVIKHKLYDAGAVYASMSGSGSTVYGIFEKIKPVKIELPPRYFVKELVGQF